MSNDIIALELNQPGISTDARRARSLLSLADQLLGLIGKYVARSANREALAFGERVEGWRKALQTETDACELAAVARIVAAECKAVLDRAQADRADRESELLDLMSVLRDVIAALRGDSQKFDADLQRSANAMESMVQINDIRELKRQLAREVQSLKETTAARAAAEARQVGMLSARVETLEGHLREVRSIAATDALTGIMNRGAFDVALREWMTRAARTGKAFTLALADLDDFKRINDTHGHPVGDRVIVAAAQLLAGCTEEGDVTCRYGGEEFALLLQTGSIGKAKERLTEALKRIAPAYEYEVAGERRLVSFTFSAGVTQFVDGDTPESIIKRVDEALYDAKRKGKNRVETRSRSFLRALVG